VYIRCQSALGLVKLHLVRGSTATHCSDQYSILFHYYSLGGDSAMLSGPTARLYYAFLVFQDIQTSLKLNFMTSQGKPAC